MVPSPLATWSRRAVSIPLVFGLAAVLLATLPVWLACGVLTDVVFAGGRSLPRTRALVLVTCYLVCEVLGVLGAFGIWLVTAGGLLGGRQRFMSANAALQRLWTRALFWAGCAAFSLKISVEGAELTRGAPFLLFVRHTSAADTVLAAVLVANPQRVVLRYVLKRELLWDPCLDIVGRRLPNAFVARDGLQSRAETAQVAALASHLGENAAVLIYPEGTRFDEAKKPRAVERLREKGHVHLWKVAQTFRSVMPPRLGGALALLDAAPQLDVVFLEHRGFEGAARLSSLWNGALVNKTIEVRFRRFPAASIPPTGKDEWLYRSWAEVDEWVTRT